MKKTHNGKQVPFFHIFNKLSDSINFTQRLFLSFIFIAVPVMAALFIGSFLFLQSSIHQSIEQTQAIEYTIIGHVQRYRKYFPGNGL